MAFGHKKQAEAAELLATIQDKLDELNTANIEAGMALERLQHATKELNKTIKRSENERRLQYGRSRG